MTHINEVNGMDVYVYPGVYPGVCAWTRVLPAGIVSAWLNDEGAKGMGIQTSGSTACTIGSDRGPRFVLQG